MDQVPSEGERKKLVLTRREKVPVETQLQTLYVRHLSIGDIRSLSPLLSTPGASDDLEKLGAAAVKCLASDSQDIEVRTPLDDSVFDALSETDLMVVVKAIADESSLGPLPKGDACAALGAAVKREIEHQSESFAKMASNLKQSLDRSFGSISESARSALTDNMVGMAAIQEALRSTSAVESLRKQYSELTDPIGNAFTNSLAASALKMPTGSESLRQAMEKSSISNAALEALAKSDPLKNWPAEPKEMGLSHIRPIALPDPEKSPIGRAAKAGEETARQLQEVAGLTAAMAAQIGELSQTIVTKAIPEWLNKIEGDRQSAQATLEQARDSLKWTKWAVTASVVVTVAMTGWQVWLASEYKRDNDEQQEAAMQVMREQLKKADVLNRQLVENAKSYREDIAAMRSRSGDLAPPKKGTAPNQKSNSTH